MNRLRQLPNGMYRVPLDLLDSRGIEKLGIDLSSHVDDQSTQVGLIRRNLGAVVRHHLHPDTSIENVRRLQAETANGAIAAAGIYDGESWRGMSVASNRVYLRRPSYDIAGLLPAQLLRRSSLLSEPVQTKGPNLMAWVDDGYSNLGALSEILGDMGMEHGECWTVEPMQNEVQSLEHKVAGLSLVGVARFADQDATGVAPVSGLYARPCRGNIEEL